MLSSSKVIKSVDVAGFTPRDIEVRKDFGVEIEPEVNPEVDRQLERARAESQKILDKARQEASQILKQAQDDKELIHAEAYQQGQTEGYQAGFQEGYEAGQAKAQELVEQKNQLVAQLTDAHQRLYRETEQAMVQLALEMAKSIVVKQVELDGEVVVEIAKSALQEAHAGETYFLYVNPQDLQTARDYLEQLKENIPVGASLQVVADSDINAGGCRVETELGTTDGTLQSRLLELEKLLGSVKS